jgi:hypothetical protein
MLILPGGAVTDLGPIISNRHGVAKAANSQTLFWVIRCVRIKVEKCYDNAVRFPSSQTWQRAERHARRAFENDGDDPRFRG